MSWEDVSKENGGEKGEKIPYTKFVSGNTLIRILDEEPYSFWNHWMPKQNTGVVCAGKGCPICAVVAAQKANKEQPTYSNSQRHAMRIWNYTTNQMEVMIQSKSFFQNLLTLHKEIGDVKTYDIKVVRKGEGTNTTYNLLPTAPKTFEHEDNTSDVNFADLFKPMDKDKVIMLMEGKSMEEVFGSKDE